MTVPSSQPDPAPAGTVAGLACRVRDGIAELRLDRPAQRNAVSEAMFAGLIERARTLGADPAVRVIVLRANGGGMFCAGADIATMADPDPRALEHHFTLLTDCVDALRATPVPVLAAIDGDCLGAGCTLAAASDVVIARDDVRFALPEIHIGLAPVLAMAALAPVVALRPLVHWSATGAKFTAADAREAGLCTQVLPAADFEVGVANAIDALARGDRAAHGHLKRAAALLGASRAEPLRAALMDEMLATATSPAARAAIAGFLARRHKG